MYTAQYADGRFEPPTRPRVDHGVAVGRFAGNPSVDGAEFWTGGTADVMALTPINLGELAHAITGTTKEHHDANAGQR